MFMCTTKIYSSRINTSLTIFTKSFMGAYVVFSIQFGSSSIIGQYWPSMLVQWHACLKQCMYIMKLINEGKL